MLFNSYAFIFWFLPATLLGFFLIGGRGHHRIATAWLVGASLFFYGWWNPAYLGLIVASMLFNYAVGVELNGRHQQGRSKKLILAAGVTANLVLLGYFKYANFFIDNLNLLIGSSLVLEQIILPLAISFFTFQQIAYLVDAYQGETREYNFLHYCLFVTFFPQLIAGPIVHHREMMPQFARPSAYRVDLDNLAVGLTLFTIGLFKKVVLADHIALYSTPLFSAADAGHAPNFFEAWCGALAYTFQLYFDFSGYADMAIGAARLFGIRLPINFNSPYKATSIIAFWRRWHITLSRFLKDYLYIPLGGNRRGEARRLTNLVVTMLLGGLWHGAGWNFVIWGGLHGLYLALNHGWRRLAATLGVRLPAPLGWLLTFLLVVVAWVFFRAETFAGALNILAGMAGQNGVVVSPKLGMLEGLGGIRLDVDFMGSIDSTKGWAWLALASLVTLALPNSVQLMRRHDPVVDAAGLDDSRLCWKPNWRWATGVALMLFFSVFSLTQVSEFLYFRF